MNDSRQFSTLDDYRDYLRKIVKSNARVRNAYAEASFSKRSQIQDDAIWDSIYIADGDNNKYPNTYVLGKPLANRNTRSLLLWKFDDMDPRE